MADLPPLEDTSTDNKTAYPEISMPINAEFNLAPSSKDMMIGSGVLIILALMFFFIRNAYVNYLVGNLKRSPNSAGLAGFGLFGALLFGSAIGCVALVSKSYLTLELLIPLGGLSFVCLMVCIIASSKK